MPSIPVSGKFIRLPHKPLHATTYSWPLAAWGIDILGLYEKSHNPRVQIYLSIRIILQMGRSYLGQELHNDDSCRNHPNPHYIGSASLKQSRLTITSPSRILVAKCIPQVSDNRKSLFTYYMPTNDLAEAYQKPSTRSSRNGGQEKNDLAR